MSYDGLISIAIAIEGLTAEMRITRKRAEKEADRLAWESYQRSQIRTEDWIWSDGKPIRRTSSLPI